MASTLPKESGVGLELVEGVRALLVDTPQLEVRRGGGAVHQRVDQVAAPGLLDLLGHAREHEALLGQHRGTAQRADARVDGSSQHARVDDRGPRLDEADLATGVVEEARLQPHVLLAEGELRCSRSCTGRSSPSASSTVSVSARRQKSARSPASSSLARSTTPSCRATCSIVGDRDAGDVGGHVVEHDPGRGRALLGDRGWPAAPPARSRRAPRSGCCSRSAPRGQQRAPGPDERAPPQCATARAGAHAGSRRCAAGRPGRDVAPRAVGSGRC